MIAKSKQVEVELELEKLVSVLVDIVPQLKQVRLSGNYNNEGNLNILIETSDEKYSYKYFRDSLRREIISEAQKMTEGIFTFHLLTSEDLQRFLEDETLRGNINSSRLLYSNKKPRILN